MHEIIVNLHNHTRYSDGTGTHADIARAALDSGLDVVIVTDHNVLVKGVDGYVRRKNKRVLLLVGEEIHDPWATPQKNHLLVIGARRELAGYSHSPQQVINQAGMDGALTYLAHPYEHPLALIKEPAIPWLDWQVQGFTGIELWNNLSEIKSVSRNSLLALFYTLFPRWLAHSPLPETLEQWDSLTTAGKRVVAVGGSDGHALDFHLGPFRRTIFPYQFHFRSINNHVLLDEPLSGDADRDRALVLDALSRGHSFVGYDLPAPTNGFRFTAQHRRGLSIMGDEAALEGSATLQIHLPYAAECRLICDGQVVQTWKGQESCTYITSQPGVYRAEVYLRYGGVRRGWIFSNPIYLRRS